MRFAIVTNIDTNGAPQKGAHVENVIELEESQKEAMEQALGKLLLDAEPLGLGPGDRYNGSHWIRDIDDEEIELPIIQA